MMVMVPAGEEGSKQALYWKARLNLRHGSISATLCDVAMPARAVPAWFPGVGEQGRGCRRAESCRTCLGSSGVCWQAAVTGGSPAGRSEALSSVSPPSLPSNRSEDEL